MYKTPFRNSLHAKQKGIIVLVVVVVVVVS